MDKIDATSLKARTAACTSVTRPTSEVDEGDDVHAVKVALGLKPEVPIVPLAVGMFMYGFVSVLHADTQHDGEAEL